ncbi:MAG: trypsin-like peptidase domain-containing protein [Patescibacteria group bacterium]|nr:trypsin-like peptidase domain-containing protein [Patescibacteria group bacterium]
MKNISPIVKIAKTACPAVITIIITKDLPKVDGFYLMPVGGRGVIMPKFKKGKKEATKIGGGSGFIVSADGYVITSNHVVADREADYTVILSPKKKYSAKVFARDPINDIAILKIKDKKFPYIALGDSSKIELGQNVVAIGNALGEFNDTLSSGIVSGLSRYIRATNHFDSRTERLRGLIQTDAAINPGNSGGPLVDMDGKVIGVNTAMVIGAQNIGFAIPINYAKKDLEEVKKYGRIKHPFLGVKYITLTEEISKKNKLPVNYGALVVRETLGEPPVIKGSAADKAGLKEFDIILEAKGKKINSEKPLSNTLQESKIGETIELMVLRKSKRITLKAKLAEKK